MSSSIFNSNQTRFVVWVLTILTITWFLVTFAPWGGIAMSQRMYIDLARDLGSDADYLIVGDSKTGPFSTNCLIPWLDPYRGAVFTADSVTPVFHWYTLRAIREQFPEFRPKVVFIFVGANNMNANGLHARRDYSFFNQLPLVDVWDLSAAKGRGLLFAEALLARVFPFYGHRVQITHLQFGDRGGRICPKITASSFEHDEPFKFADESRDPVADKNYFDIYRRSVYTDYESSAAQAGALKELIRLVQDYGGMPILILPPVTSEMWALEQQMVGQRFDETIDSILKETGVEVVDLRTNTRFEFKDVNHLSKRGAYRVAEKYLRPVLEREEPSRRD